MYRKHFGLSHIPFGKENSGLWLNGQLEEFAVRFKWLLNSPGLGLLTAEPGLGKTAAIRHVAKQLNPHQHRLHYIAETDFGRTDFYRQLAQNINLSPSYRRAQLWRDIKEYFVHLATQKNILPVLVIDEAQNLPHDFLRDFPSFLNFVMDSKDYVTVWLVGHPELEKMVDRVCHTALSSRIQARCSLTPIEDREAFRSLLMHGFESAGAQGTLLSDTGIEILRMASRGNPRQLHRIVVSAMQIAAEKKQNHLPDDVIKEAITGLKVG
jgi:type II secretory pathway predicted ATPase ExeA